jgi:CubicO group peptidase (beta-lactamase class C family)
MSIKKIFGGLIVLFLIYCIYQYNSDPLFWKRYFGMLRSMGDTPASWFSPTETVSSAHVFELPVAEEGERTVTDDALEQVCAYAEEYDSYALIVCHKGVIQIEWYRDSYDRESLTQSQSMHKSLQPILIRAAIMDGAIESIHDPIEKYITEWQHDERGKISIYQLMIMSSGLKKQTMSLNPFSDALQWLLSSDSSSVLLRTPQVMPAGKIFEYNDLNAHLLGRIVERATGIRYAEYLQEKLWEPMGGQPSKVWLDHEGGAAMSACCLLSPALNWVRIGLMFKDGGKVHGNQVVNSEWINAMITPSPLNPYYGYQIWLGYEADNTRPGSGGYWQSEPFLADDVFFGSGYGAQRFYVSRQRDLVIVRMGPSAGPKPLKDGWDNAFIFNTIVRGIKKELL